MPDQPNTAPAVILAPWTPEQVRNLNAFQSGGGMHPFTCGKDHGAQAVALIARTDGWHCSAPPCDYRQDWAHAFMADPTAWPKPFPRGVAVLPGPGATPAPAPAPVDPALQQRIARVIEECRVLTPEALTAAVLAELAPELGRAQLGDRTRQELADLAVNAANALRDEKRHYRIACQDIARLRAQLDRIRQMTDAWERQLPDTIRTATAVDAIRTALTPAAEGSQP
jgi:hypothetical protein